jgi:hypothetical protein
MKSIVSDKAKIKSVQVKWEGKEQTIMNNNRANEKWQRKYTEEGKNRSGKREKKMNKKENKSINKKNTNKI